MTKRFAPILGLILTILMVGVVVAHHATGIQVSINCEGFSVDVGFSQFGNGHRLVTTITADGVETVNTETPQGSGTLTYTGGPATQVDVLVETPDDDNAPMTASATLDQECGPSETPSPTPVPTPVATPTPTPVPTPQPTIPNTAMGN